MSETGIHCILWCTHAVILLREYVSRIMIFPTMWYVQPAKAQASLRIRTVWSEPLQVAWIFYDC